MIDFTTSVTLNLIQGLSYTQFILTLQAYLQLLLSYR